MTNTLASARTAATLDRLFAAATAQEASHDAADRFPAAPGSAAQATVAQQVGQPVQVGQPEQVGRPEQPPRRTQTPLEQADAMQDVYMPVSADGGRLLYSLTRAIRPEVVAEFGMSFGISTIFLAAGVTDNGTGRVFTTELSSAKVAAAQANLQEAGVAEAVTVLPGDARETLADLPGPVGLVLLDGWKDLYLPVLKLLEPQLTPGALIVADDSSFPSVAGYLGYVRDPANGYVTVSFPVEDGMEISTWTGR